MPIQVALTAVEQFIVQLLPVENHHLISALGLGRIAPAVAIFAALWGIFYAVTPRKFRDGHVIWPGAALIAAVWIGTTMLLPVILGQFGGYDRTYGSLAGVIVALLFFYIIGLALVIGAQLNAALAIVPKLGQNAAEQGVIEQGS